MMILITFLFTIGLVFVHIFSKNLHFLHSVQRHRFLSLSSGVAVAYVFVHLLPELNEYQKILEDTIDNKLLILLEDHIYMIAMFGLVVFYGLELIVRKMRDVNKVTDDVKASMRVFQIHISMFFIYNAIIGYLLVRGEYDGYLGLSFYFIAMAVHFITNDWSLRESHKDVYDRYGRWLLSFAVLFGWIVGAFFDIREVVVSLLAAFLAGAIILNVMKEELPEDRKSSLPAFLIGVVLYTVLILFI
ncbi:hypothetical protein ACFPYN_07795 [Paenisporosarcina macmurdoensis]|uniref:ZIP Zinc transporter n=1 Tax=Paenisporosarcina macmurdoensis TaxID=212659 RepID=A0ABW1L7I1_9BACL